jgi:hypothetical protein
MTYRRDSRSQARLCDSYGPHWKGAEGYTMQPRNSQLLKIEGEGEDGAIETLLEGKLKVI